MLANKITIQKDICKIKVAGGLRLKKVFISFSFLKPI